MKLKLTCLLLALAWTAQAIIVPAPDGGGGPADFALNAAHAVNIDNAGGVNVALSGQFYNRLGVSPWCIAGPSGLPGQWASTGQYQDDAQRSLEDFTAASGNGGTWVLTAIYTDATYTQVSGWTLAHGGTLQDDWSTGALSGPGNGGSGVLFELDPPTALVAGNQLTGWHYAGNGSGLGHLNPTNGGSGNFTGSFTGNGSGLGHLNPTNGGLGSFTGSFTGDGSALTALPANVVTNFPNLNLVTVGDSLTSTDTTPLVSYPVIMAAQGWTVLTNYAVGGQAVGTIVGTYIPGVITKTPIYTGQRTAMLICGGKNDEYNMLASASNTVAASVESTLYNGYMQAWADGCDVVAIELPYSDGRYYPAYTNSNFCTDLINLWVRQLATNSALLHGNYVSVPVTATFPAASYTNADGSLNTNVTLDGVHFSYIGKTNEARLIAQTISNSAAWTKSSAVLPTGIGSTPGNFWQSISITNVNTGSKLALADWSGSASGTSSVAMYYGGNTSSAFWQLGLVIQSGRDLNTPGTGTWGITMMDATHTHGILFYPNADSIFLGATNKEAITHAGGFDLRGRQWYEPINQVGLPSDGTVQIYNAGNADTGFHIDLSAGDLKFDGVTLRCTNVTALGVFTGNGSGLTNVAAVKVATNTVPTPVAGYGYFWPSNYNLYWVTPTRTNLIVVGQ